MIAWLSGQLLSVDEDSAIVVVNGVGYQVLCPVSTLDHLHPHAPVELHVYTHVREDVLQLFGFIDAREKTLFLSLIKVNGVGPRSALHMMSASSWSNIVNFIETGDVKGLSALPKIGKKTAEQIVLTLKGKLVLTENNNQKKSEPAVREQIVSALLHLGFKQHDIEKTVANLDPKVDVERGVRDSLAVLSGGF